MYNVDITGIYTDRIILEDEKCTLKDNRDHGLPHCKMSRLALNGRHGWPHSSLVLEV